VAELVILNPVAEKRIEKFDVARRRPSLEGKTVGLYWNGKPGGEVLLEHSAELLRQKYGGIEFKNFLGQAGSMMRHLTPKQADQIANECEAVIGATSD